MTEGLCFIRSEGAVEAMGPTLGGYAEGWDMEPLIEALALNACDNEECPAAPIPLVFVEGGGIDGAIAGEPPILLPAGLWPPPLPLPDEPSLTSMPPVPTFGDAECRGRRTGGLNVSCGALRARTACS